MHLLFCNTILAYFFWKYISFNFRLLPGDRDASDARFFKHRDRQNSSQIYIKVIIDNQFPQNIEYFFLFSPYALVWKSYRFSLAGARTRGSHLVLFAYFFAFFWYFQLACIITSPKAVQKYSSSSLAQNYYCLHYFISTFHFIAIKNGTENVFPF